MPNTEVYIELPLCQMPPWQEVCWDNLLSIQGTEEMPGDGPVYHNMLPPNELTTEHGGDLQKTGIVTAS